MMSETIQKLDEALKKSIRLGFTGTQDGMTIHQKNTINGLLQSIGPTEFHHGDCIGADADFHDLAIKYATPVLHPPNISTKRAFKTANILRAEKAYLERNRDIVDEVDIMIGCPKTFQEELRSGTWATIRYAKKQNRHTIIVWPDGTTEEHNLRFRKNEKT